MRDGATALGVPAPGRTYQCTVKITKMGESLTCLEIALQNTLKFYYKIWRKLGHGNYLNSSYGETYSHSDAAMNQKYGTFTFKQGDVAEMKFDATAMELRLRCNE
jgi:hypothetical protein